MQGAPDSTTTGRTLVLSDGNLPSLLAAAIGREAIVSAGGRGPDPMMMFWGGTGPTTELRKKAMQLQAEAFQFEIVRDGPRLGSDSDRAAKKPAGFDTADQAPQDGEMESMSLFAAVSLAARKGCSNIIWPVQGFHPLEDPAVHERADDLRGLDLDLIARATDKAVLIGRLVSLDVHEHGQVWVKVETPFVDLKDRQIADLAAEMEVPLHACWWWGTPVRFEPGVRERARWYRAFEAAGWASVIPSGAIGMGARG